MAYQALLPRLLVPPLWETQGAVMSLARLMQAYLLHNMDAVVKTNKVSLISMSRNIVIDSFVG